MDNITFTMHYTSGTVTTNVRVSRVVAVLLYFVARLLRSEDQGQEGDK